MMSKWCRDCSKAFKPDEFLTAQGFSMEDMMIAGQQQGLLCLTWVPNDSNEAAELMAWHHKIRRHVGGIACDIRPVRPLPLRMLGSHLKKSNVWVVHHNGGAVVIWDVQGQIAAAAWHTGGNRGFCCIRSSL